jgi:hypothetical protein
MGRVHSLVGALALSCALLGAPGTARAEDDDRPAPIAAAKYAADMHAAAVLTLKHEVHHDTLPSLRNTPVPVLSGGERINFEGPLPLPPGADQQTEGALQGPAHAPLPATPSPLSTFDGVGNGFTGPQGAFVNLYIPPDTVGAIGTTQYVQAVNDHMAVFDKVTKSVLYGPVPESILWVGFGGGCETNNDGDPVVVYDKAADRWVVSQFSVSSTPYLQCVAVSQTNDATGAWNRYAFAYANFPDYPKMGVWPDAYYETFNMFQGNSFTGANLCAYDRTAMLAGNAATQQCFQLASSFGGVLPSDLDGNTPPPAGSPNFLVNFGTNALNLWKFHVDWATPANTTLTGPTSIPVAAFSPACNGGTCIPEPGSGKHTIDSLGDRLMFRLAYRNFGANESLVVSHSVRVGTGKSTQTGVRWYELRSPGTTPVVYQQATYSPDTTLYRWMPSIAMDGDGDIAVGYSTSSTSAFPSIAYTGRLVTDTLSTMGSEVAMKAGFGSQSGNRWGDYSAMTVDPSDDCTFWYTNEYFIAAANGTNKWSTRIGSFRFPSCGATRVPSKLAFQMQPNASYVSGATISVSVAVEDSSGHVVDSDNSQITLALQGGSAGATLGGTTTVNAVNGVATFNVSVDKVGIGYSLHATDAALTAADSSAFDITVGAPANILFAQGPSDAVAGASIAPAIVVHVQDAGGNAVSGDSVSLALSSNPGGSTLTGGGAVATNSSGDATFSGVSLDKAGIGYKLTASDSSVPPLTATSGAFNILAGGPTQLVFTIQPTDVTQGSAVATIAVTEEDVNGNVVVDNSSSADFTIAACSGNVDLGSAPMVNGVATLSGSAQRFYTLAAGLQISASDASLSIGGQSQTFGVNANADMVFSDGFDGCRL